MTDCEKIRPLLSEYLDGCLPEEETLLVKEHLSECSDCTKRLAFMQTLMAGLREEKVTVPEGLAPSIMEKISGRSKKRGIFFARPFTAAAVVVLLAIVGWQALHNGGYFRDENLALDNSEVTAQGSIPSDTRAASPSDIQTSESESSRSKTFAAEDSATDTQTKITEAPATANGTALDNKASSGQNGSNNASGSQESSFKANIMGFAPQNRGYVTYSNEPAKAPVDIPYALLAVIEANESQKAEIVKGLKVQGEGYYLADEKQWQSVLNKANQREFSITIYNSTTNMKDGVLITFK